MKIILIDNCIECPLSELKNIGKNTKVVCSSMAGDEKIIGRLDAIDMSIPNWCPLEEASEIMMAWMKERARS